MARTIGEHLKMSNQESNRFTKECLQTALIALMSQKPFDKITISELVRRSGVSRTAFYRNYSSKEEILNEMANFFLKSLEASFKDPAYKNNLTLWYETFFGIIRENAGLFRLLIQAHLINTSIISTYSLERRLAPAAEQPGHYEFLAWLGAFSSIVIHWFSDQMTESDSEMAALCARLLSLWPDN